MRRLGLPRVVALACVLGAAVTARVAGFPPEVAAALGLVAAWRIAGGADGRALLPRRVRIALGALAALLGVLVLYEFAVGASDPLVGMLVLVAFAETLCLLGIQAPFVVFLTLLLSTTHVAGAAFRVHDAAALALTTSYFVVLTWALVLLERNAASRKRTGSRGTSRRIVIGRLDRLPAGAVARSVLGLVSLGVVGGLALFVLAPREPFLPRSDKKQDEVGSSPLLAGNAADWSVGSASFTHRTGPGEKGIRLGDVGKIKRDLTPYFEVTLPRGRGVWLRENAYAVYREGDWSPINSDVPDPWGAHPDPDLDGWIPVDGEDDAVRGFDLRIRIVLGPQRRLYLARDPVRIRLLRRGRPLGAWLECTHNAQFDCSVALQAGDIVEERAVPPESDHRILARARSDSQIAPRAEFTDLPAECLPLAAVARSVVGEETSPWRRAVRLERWLRGEDFTYTLRMPERSSRTPVVDFVLHRRRGHCEYFASSLTLLLRSLGHPARIVRGFRGGDWQAERETWLVRGTHYHAWTEMFLDGLGWIALDPTPPDREAADALTVTMEAGRRDAGGRSFIASLLGFGPEQRRAMREALGEFFHRFVEAPLAFAFGRRGGYAGYLVLLVGIAVWLRRRRRRRVARTAGFDGRKLPPGPYGRALALLARRGFRRRRTQTGREFERAVGQLLPAAKAPLGELTRLYEELRFGGRRSDGELECAAKRQLDALAAVTERSAQRS